MVKKLRFGKVQLVERQGALLLVQFLDDAGELYDWAPKWADVEQIFLKAINIERFNKPEGLFLNKFAATAKQVVEGAQRIESCEKVSGKFERLVNGQLQIRNGGGEYHSITPGFEVSLRFLDDWIGRYIDILVVNNIGIEIKGGYQNEEGNTTYDIYPPKDIE